MPRICHKMTFFAKRNRQIHLFSHATNLLVPILPLSDVASLFALLFLRIANDDFLENKEERETLWNVMIKMLTIYATTFRGNNTRVAFCAKEL